MRDTNHDWNLIAERAPYYGVVAIEKFLSPTKDNLVEFFRTGNEYIEGELSFIRKTFGSFEPKSSLDFGCGVGRLLIPMAKEAGHACGVDVADKMLAMAGQHAREYGADVELVKKIPTGRTFDWVNSFIVLQHIHPSVGYAIIEDLWSCVAPGGIIDFQLTAYKDSRMAYEIHKELDVFKYDGDTVKTYSSSKIDAGHLSMFDYDIGRVLSIFNLEYGHFVAMRKTDHGGCHGFNIYIKKDLH